MYHKRLLSRADLPKVLAGAVSVDLQGATGFSRLRDALGAVLWAGRLRSLGVPSFTDSHCGTRVEVAP